MNQTRLSLQDMVSFAQLMQRFQDVLRVVDLARGGARENDVEHSYQLAMMAWYLNDRGSLGYDLDKIIRYALVHDLAEVYAGDVHAFDEVGRRGKAQREAAAVRQILAEFPATAGMLATLHDYEARQDTESEFIYALDKLMPVLMIYLEGGRTWRREGLKLNRLHANKLVKVAGNEPVRRLYEELKAVLDDHPELFPN